MFIIVLYFFKQFIAEIKNYNYGPEHPMKPKRVAMTHDLITKYNMYHEMKVYVWIEFGFCF